MTPETDRFIDVDGVPMQNLIARLSGSATVLFCSHILSDVQEVCDTVGVLKDGHLLFQGSLDDLLVGHAAPGYTVRVRPPVGPVVEALAHQPCGPPGRGDRARPVLAQPAPCNTSSLCL